MISPDRILYEDDYFLAVNKLSGELVVKGSSLRRGYGRQEGKVEKLPLYDFLKKDYPGLRVLHRLDFETSGVVLFSKTKEAYEGVRALHRGEWKKTYRTLVVGRVQKRSGIIRKKLAARGQGSVDAETRYRILKCWKDLSFVEAEIETGRHHQIRKHFAYIGHPLVLDGIYGDERFNKKFAREFRLKKFFLHAYSVELKHPVTRKQLRIEAAMPKIFEDLVASL
ncbi:RluA family pseudouridine synthase [Patescibacteria group bacterium]|nr:RluA family pseudouridine synthase [Patescibacteria group bacterium]MBU2259964.1 RluA family pseudouridine synthase [Patescibacteria group bacterium]